MRSSRAARPRRWGPPAAGASRARRRAAGATRSSTSPCSSPREHDAVVGGVVHVYVGLKRHGERGDELTLARVPFLPAGDQPRAQRAHRLQASAFQPSKRYPTPRTVTTCRGRCGSGSSFARSCWMKLSIVRGVPWWFGPQTRAKMASRPSAAPRASMRQSEQVELGRRHLDRRARARHRARRDVDAHLAELVHRPRRPRPARGPRRSAASHAGEELGQAEGLRDVVLGAELEPRDLVHLAGARAQDDDGHRLPLAPQRLEHLEAVQLGQHHVEDDQVGLLGAGDRRALARRPRPRAPRSPRPRG